MRFQGIENRNLRAIVSFDEGNGKEVRDEGSWF